MAEKVIVNIITVLVIICLFVYCVDVISIISKNMEFRDICRGYMHIAEQNSGLNDIHKAELVQDLMNNGFTEISVQTTSAVAYGSAFMFNVSASFDKSVLEGIFNRNLKQYIMNFEQKITARKIY